MDFFNKLVFINAIDADRRLYNDANEKLEIF